MAGDGIGYRVAWWRTNRGMTGQQLADAIGISEPYVSMIESGIRPVTKRALLYRLAEGLGVSITDLTGQPAAPRSAVERPAHAAVPAIRRALDAVPPLRRRSVDYLEGVADSAMRSWMAADWNTLGSVLPPLISATVQLADDGDERGLALHVQACVVAGLAVKPLGHPDLCRVFAERALGYARRLGDPAHLGAAQYVLAQAILSAGSRERSHAVAARAAERLQPDATTDASRTWYVMLNLHAALAAASAGKTHSVAEHLDEAGRVVHEIDGNPWHVECTADNVKLWAVGIALENGDPGRAPDAARKVDPTRLRSTDRRVRYHIDLGRGLYAAGRPDEAARELLAADEIAPQATRPRPVVREIVAQLVRDSQGGSALRELTLRLSIDPAAPPEPTGDGEPWRSHD